MIAASPLDQNNRLWALDLMPPPGDYDVGALFSLSKGDRRRLPDSGGPQVINKTFPANDFMDDFGLREEHLLYRPPLALVAIKLLGVTTRKCQNWGELKERLTSIAKQSFL